MMEIRVLPKFIREGAPIVDVDARPVQACPAGQRGDVWIRPRYDGHRTARSPFGEIERKALDSGTCRSANRAPNVRVGSRTDLRRHHLEGLFPGVKRTQPARKRTSALEDYERGAGWLNVALCAVATPRPPWHVRSFRPAGRPGRERVNK